MVCHRTSSVERPATKDFYSWSLNGPQRLLTSVAIPLRKYRGSDLHGWQIRYGCFIRSVSELARLCAKEQVFCYVHQQHYLLPDPFTYVHLGVTATSFKCSGIAHVTLPPR
jgi:hypothetical protein